jgi:hypothetical protein
MISFGRWECLRRVEGLGLRGTGGLGLDPKSPIPNPSWCAVLKRCFTWGNPKTALFAPLSTGRVTRPVGEPEQFAHPQNPKSKIPNSPRCYNNFVTKIHILLDSGRIPWHK